ncbi:hypothetical protein [Shewanella sp. UCD-KL12]|uniref:hypothetical protein n=1 Tax=Shewanella sp. UCD-KL12 TaxID=1917163 RepID=UPI0009705148|nr:hypothetical protein [Shewanella sp. UCD-KL12]
MATDFNVTGISRFLECYFNNRLASQIDKALNHFALFDFLSNKNASFDCSTAQIKTVKMGKITVVVKAETLKKTRTSADI